MDRPYVPHTSSSGAVGISGRVTPQIIDIMLRTKGWVRFIAVMLFINFGITIINLIVTMNAPSRFGGDAERNGQFIGIGVALLLYLYPAVKLNSYASRIGALLLACAERAPRLLAFRRHRHDRPREHLRALHLYRHGGCRVAIELLTASRADRGGPPQRW